MNLFDYLANSVPNDCYMVMQERAGRSLPKPRRARQLSMMLNRYVQHYGKDALNDLMAIHPDRNMILSSNSGGGITPTNFGINEVVEVAERPHEDKDYVSSDCGCGGGKKKGGCSCGGKCGDKKGGCGCGGKCGEKKGGCGCGGHDEEKNFSNLVQGLGATTNSEIQTQSKTHEILISVGVILLGIAVVVKVMK